MYGERREAILRLLAGSGYMTVEELAARLYVSAPTIRRDLVALAQEGAFRRNHGGSTCSYLAETLDPSLRLTLLNNCFPTIQKLSENRHFTVECPCGQYVPSHVGIFGEEAETFIRRRHADYYFDSAAGLDAQAGVTVRALVEMSVKRAMRENADCTVLLLDRSKMGVRNYYQVFALAEIDILITDAPLPAEIRAQCDAKGVDVIVCE